jgi:hypothetical protein
VKHLERCAALARSHGMERLKLYLMVGLPTETDDDIDECARFTTELSEDHPRLARHRAVLRQAEHALDGTAFAGIDVVDARLARLRRGLRGKADVRSTSAKWAWVEYVLAQGGEAEGLAVVDAVHAGGRFAAYKRAFQAVAKYEPAAEEARDRERLRGHARDRCSR